MPRPRVPLLSTERIADAAIELVDSGESFGVNALARRLGVTPSSLYNHVDGRDGIVELIRGRLAAQFLADLPSGDWEQTVVGMLRAERALYAAHPFAVPLIVGKTVTDSAVNASYDRLASALVAGGFPEERVLAVVAVIDAFAIGFGLDLAAPDDIWRPDEPTAVLGRLIEAGAVGRERSDDAFELGLEVLLDGLRRELARHAPTAGHSLVE